MPSVASKVKAGGAFKVVDASDIEETADAKVFTAEERARLAGIEVSTFETLDTSTVMYVTDEGGRVMFTLPDPAVTANNSAIATLQASATTSEVFETLDAGAALWVLDAGQRVVGQVADNATVQGHSAAIADLQASSAGLGLFETLDTSMGLIVTDAGDRIIQAIYTTDPALALAVATNTSAVAALTSRVAAITTPDGAPAIGAYRPRLMRQTKAMLAMLQAGTALNSTGLLPLVSLAGMGDSYSHNPDRWCGKFANEGFARFGDGGAGFTGFGFLTSSNTAPWVVGNQPNFKQGNVRAAYAVRHYGNVVGTYYSAQTADLSMATLTQAGDAVEQDFPANHPNTVARLGYIAAAGAAARITRDGGGTWTALDLSANPGVFQYIDIAALLPASAGTIRIEWVSGSCAIWGTFCRAAYGYVFNKLAATGSRVGQYAAVANTANFRLSLQMCDITGILYMDGTNSQGANIPVTTWGDQIATLVGGIRTALPGVDIACDTPAENQRDTNVIAIADYERELRKRALTLRIAVDSDQDSFGDGANPAEYGDANANPNLRFYHSDKIHPVTGLGGWAMAQRRIESFYPPMRKAA